MVVGMNRAVEPAEVVLVIRRVFEAPRRLVVWAWTRPEHHAGAAESRSQRAMWKPKSQLICRAVLRSEHAACLTTTRRR